jgi:hypothetical protein
VKSLRERTLTRGQACGLVATKSYLLCILPFLLPFLKYLNLCAIIFSLSLVKLGFPAFTLFNAYGSIFSDTLVGEVALVSKAALVTKVALVGSGISVLDSRDSAALGNNNNFQV